MSSVEKFLKMIEKYHEEAINLLEEIETKKNEAYLVILKKINKSSAFRTRLNARNKIVQGYDIKKIQQIGFQYFDLQPWDINKLDDEQLLDFFQICYTASIILKNNIKYYNLLRQTFKNNKVKNYIDIRLILQLLLYGWYYEDLNGKDVSTILGMTLKRDSLEDIEESYAQQIKNLAKFYTSNGTLITFYRNNLQEASCDYNDYLTEFIHNIKSLCMVYTDYSIFREKRVDPSYRLMLESIINYFIDAYNQEIPKVNTDFKKSIQDSTSPKQISIEEALEYLKKYYQKGYLFKIPEDIEKFYECLQVTPISKKEKDYIEQLLNSSLNDPLVNYLSLEDLGIYLQILREGPKSESVQKDRNSLLEIMKLRKECHSLEDTEILQQEVKAIMEKWQKYLQTKQYSNIIFLNSPNQMSFLEDDILDNWANLYPSLQQGLIALQSKQLPLELLNPIKGVDFAFYVAHCDKIDLYLIEICVGIYVAVGATTKGQKNRFIQNRVFKYKNILDYYQNLVLDNYAQNNLLQEELKSWQELVRTKE